MNTWGALMECSTVLTSCIVSGTMHLLMALLVKLTLLCISMNILMVLSVKTIKVTKVELRHIKAFKCFVEMEGRASWEGFTSSAVEEKRVVMVKEIMRTENVVVIVCIASGTVKWAVTKLIILPALLLVTEHLICCAHSPANTTNYKHGSSK